VDVSLPVPVLIDKPEMQLHALPIALTRNGAGIIQ